MILSRYEVDPSRCSAAECLRDRYKMHMAVERAYASDGCKEGEGRLLWRVDRHAKGGPCLLVVSPAEPSEANILADVMSGDAGAFRCTPYDGVLDSVREGARYRFEIEYSADYRDHGRRRYHMREPYMRGWLLGADAVRGSYAGRKLPTRFDRQGRARRNGFEVVGFMESRGSELVDIVKPNGERILFMSASYGGVAEVTDVERFRKVLTCGIGREKGFGCGLMTLSEEVAA